MSRLLRKGQHDLYAAAERKLQVAKGTFKTDYVGNRMYENGTLKRILVGGGYYMNGNCYFYTIRC